MDRDTIDLIKRTVAKGATDDELQMFINQCDKYDLDPLANEIYFVKYPNKKDPKNPTVSIQYGIDGLLKIAHKSDDYEGIIAFSVYENDEFEAYAHDHQIFITHKFKITNRGGLTGAWAQVNRRGMNPFIKVVAMNDFYKPDNFWWDTYPSDMIEKTAKKKALNDAYGISRSNTEDNDKTSKIMLSTNEKPLLSADNFEEIVEKIALPEKTKTKSKKKKTSKKKTLKKIKKSAVMDKETVYKFIVVDGKKYYYDTVDICRDCEIEKLICTGSLTCWDCDNAPREDDFEVIGGDGQEELVEKDRVLSINKPLNLTATQKDIDEGKVISAEKPKGDIIFNPEAIKVEKPKTDAPLFSFMKKKKEEPKGVDFKKLLKKETHEEKIEKEVQKDLNEIPTKPLKFSLEFQDTLDEETKLYKGDDWYCSSTAKKQLKKDLPLTTFIVVVTQTFPKHVDAIDALFKEQMGDKKRAESLLFIYYNALRDYLEIEIKEDDRGVDLLFAQRIARIIKSLYNLPLTGTIEEMHTIIKEATDWKDDWVKWAIKFLKARGHI